MNPLNLPELAEWASASQNKKFDAKSFILNNLTVAEGVALSMIMWPEFIAYRDGVFLGYAFDPRTADEWFVRLDTLAAVEAVVNHVHVRDMFPISTDSEEEAAVFFADVLAKSWRASLALRFPGRSFDVTVSNSPDQYGPEVSFTSSTG
jgi:hypothetical protein